MLENKLSASIRRDVEEKLPRLYRAAHRAAILVLEEYEETRQHGFCRRWVPGPSRTCCATIGTRNCGSRSGAPGVKWGPAPIISRTGRPLGEADLLSEMEARLGRRLRLDK